MDKSRLTAELRGAGLRATAPRRAVIRVLEDAGEHLSAEDIHRALAENGVRIDLSSVYRTLALLVRLGLVRPVGPAERHGHFEVGHEEQVHLTCACCGGVIEAALPRGAQVERAVTALARSRGFGLTEFTIEANGECAACRRRSRKRSERRAPARAAVGAAAASPARSEE
ncbi:MAG TPA: Fur family transcriptional regulator [Armatimonadota bacterium]|nr:Fur family transcriptional regulator [Armatimonadota bacterium]